MSFYPMIAGQSPSVRYFNMAADDPNRKLHGANHAKDWVGPKPSFLDLPNFRLLCCGGPRSYLSVDKHKDGDAKPADVVPPSSRSVFRSSRPDFLGEDDLGVFRKLGIQSIIDFRSKHEYFSADGNQLLDREYPLYRVKFPRGRNYRHNELVELESVEYKLHKLNSPRSNNCDVNEPLLDGSVDTSRKHFLINFFTVNYVWNIFNRAPWYIRLGSLLVLIFDLIFRTQFKNFVRLFARTTLNPTGLVGQYKDMIEFSQRSICAALKLLAEEENTPALLNCAHGKDRTGIVSALVLACLGHSPQYIADEYALSADGLSDMQQRLQAEVVERFHMSEDFISAKSETMRELFSFIVQRYGSVENYLECIGFGADEQARLRRNLLHKADTRTLDISTDETEIRK